MKNNTLQQFFAVLSSKIMNCCLMKNTLSKLDFFRNENVDGLDSKFNGSETRERTVNFSVPQGGMPTSNTKIISGGFYPFWIAFLLFAMLPILAVGQITYCAGDPDPSSQTDLRPLYTKGACGTANDVILLGARLVTEGACNTCTSGGNTTARLLIQAHNTSASGRWLGVFADLVTTTTTCKITRCSANVLVGQSDETLVWTDGITTYQEVDFGELTFKCGDALTLTDILAVFNTPNAGCPVGYQSAKWCYNTPVIVITPPLNAVAEASCGTGNTANIALTVTGGKGPFTYSWTGPNGYTSVDKDLMGVALGTYAVTVTDKGQTDGSGNFCTTSTTVTFNGPCCTTPVIANKTATICSGTSFTVTPTNGSGEIYLGCTCELSFRGYNRRYCSNGCFGSNQSNPD